MPWALLTTLALTAARLPPPASAPSGPPTDSIVIARVHYGGGGNWYVSPSALPNLIRAVRQETTIPVASREHVVTPLDPSLDDYPLLYMTGNGNVSFTPSEREALRNYLLDGGFLLVNDSFGLAPSFRAEMAKVFPDSPLVEIPSDHPIFHTVFDFPDGLPKIHEHDGKPAEAFGIFHRGRLMVLFVYESDIGDGWEDPDVHDDPPAMHQKALRMGVDIVAYVVSQTAP